MLQIVSASQLLVKLSGSAVEAPPERFPTYNKFLNSCIFWDQSRDTLRQECENQDGGSPFRGVIHPGELRRAEQLRVRGFHSVEVEHIFAVSTKQCQRQSGEGFEIDGRTLVLVCSCLRFDTWRSSSRPAIRSKDATSWVLGGKANENAYQ